MKIKNLLLTSFIVIVGLHCKKTSLGAELPSDVIAGKWTSVAGYAGYADGGDFTWHPIAAADAITYQFKTDSTFIVNGYGDQCFPATYRKTGQKLFLQYKCDMLDSVTIKKLTADTLITERNVIEGSVETKFIAVK